MTTINAPTLSLVDDAHHPPTIPAPPKPPRKRKKKRQLPRWIVLWRGVVIWTLEAESAQAAADIAGPVTGRDRIEVRDERQRRVGEWVVWVRPEQGEVK